jgi:hypothetical protein
MAMFTAIITTLLSILATLTATTQAESSTDDGFFANQTPYGNAAHSAIGRRRRATA